MNTTTFDLDSKNISDILENANIEFSTLRKKNFYYLILVTAISVAIIASGIYLTDFLFLSIVSAIVVIFSFQATIGESRKTLLDNLKSNTLRQVLKEVFSEYKISYEPNKDVYESISCSKLFKKSSNHSGKNRFDLELNNRSLSFSEVLASEGTGKSKTTVIDGLVGRVDNVFLNETNNIVNIIPKGRSFLLLSFFLSIVFYIVSLPFSPKYLGDNIQYHISYFVVLLITIFLVSHLFRNFIYNSFQLKTNNKDFDNEFEIKIIGQKKNYIVEDILNIDLQYKLLDFAKTIKNSGYKRVNFSFENSILYFYIEEGSFLSAGYSKNLKDSTEENLLLIDSIIKFVEGL